MLSAVEWKCITRKEDNYPDTADEWQPDPNNAFTTPTSGYGGVTSGSF